eukprot:8530520-Ditylum_brightwellii.AAC.1
MLPLLSVSTPVTANKQKALYAEVEIPHITTKRQQSELDRAICDTSGETCGYELSNHQSATGFEESVIGASC